jgi:hypothetical protein
MLVRISCHKSQIESYTDHYESLGYTLLEKHFELEEAVLVFKGVSTAHVADAVAYDPNAQAFIEFADGSKSPLYVRTNRWSSD